MHRSLGMIAWLGIAANVGCASIGVRTGAYSKRAPVYPAISADAGLISYAVSRPFLPMMDPTFAPDAQEGLVYLFLPVALIDLPIALTLDTLLLPLDVYKLSSDEEDK
jgi:uncharacterized protein YceK